MSPKCNKQCRLRRRLRRRHKNIIHFLVLLAIAISLAYEGAKAADLLFLALSVLTEVS